MNQVKAVFLHRDHDLTAGIVPEVYLRCPSIAEMEYSWPHPALERQATEIRLAWSAQALYGHFWARDGHIVAGDRLSFYLQTPDQTLWTWSVNPLGQLTSSQRKTQARSLVRRHDAGWVWELKIPLAKELAVQPTVGQSWRVNFYRVDFNLRGLATCCAWSGGLEPNGEVSAVEPFGTLHFV